MSGFDAPLPIDAVIPALTAALDAGSSAVLVAPPGAGKTTRIPLVLLEAQWSAHGKLILLEPRRIAARSAAERMAQTLGESVGETVGLRVRLDSRVSARTRIEVVTEGVFARMVVDDPALTGVAGVLFDEFHERSLDADLGLALALDAQQGLREDLRLLVMSATLDGARVARLLGAAPVIQSQGRSFPVETRYVARDPGARLEEEMARVIARAVRAEPGSILAFLPGQGEILRTADLLRARLADDTIDLAPLFGQMDRRAQHLAIAASLPGRRKIVLATAIAETSLTIEGVRVVVDCGLARLPRYEPDLGLMRLETVRVSRASADQRRGRAGRTAPGVCYRLWEEAATGALPAFSPPEILAADLSGLLLDCTAWGVRDPAGLAWLDPPPAPAVDEARALLRSLGALDRDGALTETGTAMRALPLPPRLARMVVVAARTRDALLAATIAAVLTERFAAENPDIATRVEHLQRDGGPRGADLRKMAQRWAALAAGKTHGHTTSNADVASVGRLVALAFPDRVAKARGAPGTFLMANGRAAMLGAHEALAREPALAIAEISGRAAAARILAAAPLALAEIETAFADCIEKRTETIFDRTAAALRRRQIRTLGAITLSERVLPVDGDAQAATTLAQGLATLGIGRLPWTKDLRQWRTRVAFLARAHGAPWPDLSDAALTADVQHWLAPFLAGKNALSDITGTDLEQALHALLPWALLRQLDEEAPTHFEAPTGSRVALDYEDEAGPVLAIRVQELFGLSRHPCLAGGAVPLTLHLLSPAQRPIQITRDLPGFWRGSWSGVKAEMKGRYPRHPWPDDPATASPTARAKPRGT